MGKYGRQQAFLTENNRVKINSKSSQKTIDKIELI